MKTTLFMAMSTNGIIADKNGSEDFLSHKNWEAFVEIANEIGNFIVGRKTYEVVQNWSSGYGFDDLIDLEGIVLTHSGELENYTTASSPDDALQKLSTKGFKEALVIGGSQVNAAFASAGLFDEVLLNLEPVLLGEGVPLLAPQELMLRLNFVESREIGEGILQLRYEVVKSEPATFGRGYKLSMPS